MNKQELIKYLENELRLLEEKHDKLTETDYNYNNYGKIMYTRGKITEIEIILNRLEED